VPDHSPGDPEEKERQENLLINEEYKIWKKNSPMLYDLLYALVLH
jgi:histone-binding protein RBBP4